MTKNELVKIIKEELNIVLEAVEDAAYWERVLDPRLVKAIEGSGINMSQWAEFMKASNSKYATAPEDIGRLYNRRGRSFFSSDPELKGMWKRFNNHADNIHFLGRQVYPNALQIHLGQPLTGKHKSRNRRLQKLIKQHTKEIKHILTKNKKVLQIMKGLRTRFSGGVSIAPKSKAGQLTIADISDDKALAVINKQATDSKFKKLLKKMPIVGRFLVVAGLVAGAEDAYAKGGASGLASFVGKSGLEMTPILGDIISAVELARIAGAPASAMDPRPGLRPGLKL